MHMGKTWTSERVDELKSLVTRGYSGGLIAQGMRLSRSTIIGKAHRLGLRIIGHETGMRLPNHANDSRQAAALAKRQNGMAATALRSAGDGRWIEPVVFSTIWDLAADACRWPMWAHDQWPNGASPYCGCATNGKRYCPHHARKNKRGLVAEDAAS
jgi:hypothetical protein